MATHSSSLVWEIPWIEAADGPYRPWGCTRVRNDLSTKQQEQQKIDSTDVEKKCMVTKGEKEDKLGIWGLIYTLLHIN